MATIEIDSVTKVYGNGFLAVDDVSIEIADGEFVVLVGPSGLRQVDAPADDRRPRGGHRGRPCGSAAPT